jgi:hypothetical protein
MDYRRSAGPRVWSANSAPSRIGVEMESVRGSLIGSVGSGLLYVLSNPIRMTTNAVSAVLAYPTRNLGNHLPMA